MAVTNDQIKAELLVIKTILESRMLAMEESLKDTKEKVDHLDKDMRGNGTPGVKERVNHIEKIVNALIAVSGSVGIAVIVDIAVRLVNSAY